MDESNEKFDSFQDNDNESESKNEYYNLPLASMTFGRDANRQMFQVSKPAKEETPLTQNEKAEQNLNQQNGLDNDNNNNLLYSIPINIENLKISSHNKTPSNVFGNCPNYSFKNSFGAHNSFLISVVNILYNMKPLRKFIINDLTDIKSQDQKAKLIYSLRNILLQCNESSQNISVSELRATLAELFQNRKKFVLDYPDDPCDCFFAILNSFHSFYLQLNPNDITDESCRTKCFAHKYFWLDFARIDECDCKVSMKRYCSNFNYVFDIPFDRVLDMVRSSYSQGNMSIRDSLGRLFDFYNLVFNKFKVNCPVNGNRCSINSTHKKLVLNNTPYYFTFSLQQEYFPQSVMDLLQRFVVIPKKIDIDKIFEINQKNGSGSNNAIFSLLGIIMVNNNKIYSSAFKSEKENWTFIQEDKNISLPDWYDLISLCIQNGNTPVMLFYKMNNEDDPFSFNVVRNKIFFLEKYALNADSFSNNSVNKLRITEELLPTNKTDRKFTNMDSGDVSRKNVKKGNSNISSSDQSVSSIEQMAFNLHNFEYICPNCRNKNKLESQYCSVCKTNNINVVKNILLKFQLQGKTETNSNLNTNRSISIIQTEPLNKRDRYSLNEKKYIENNLVGKKINFSQDEESFEPKSKKNYDMPKPYIPKKDKPVIIKESQKFTPPPFDIILDSQPSQTSQTTQQNQQRPKTYQHESIHNTSNLRGVSSQNKPTKMEHEHRGFYRAGTKPHSSKKIDGIFQQNSHQPVSSAFSKNPNQYRSNPDHMTINNDIWVCSNCSLPNRDVDFKCKNCKFSRKNDLGYARMYTPKMSRSNGDNRISPNMHNQNVGKKTIEKSSNCLSGRTKLNSFGSSTNDSVMMSNQKKEQKSENRRKGISGIHYNSNNEFSRLSKNTNSSNVGVKMQTNIEQRMISRPKTSTSSKLRLGKK